MACWLLDATSSAAARRGKQRCPQEQEPLLGSAQRPPAGGAEAPRCQARCWLAEPASRACSCWGIAWSATWPAVGHLPSHSVECCHGAVLGSQLTLYPPSESSKSKLASEGYFIAACKLSTSHGLLLFASRLYASYPYNFWREGLAQHHGIALLACTRIHGIS